jgi:Zn2+/Cd2+-exporting ATPase
VRGEVTQWMVGGVCCAMEEHVLRKSLDGWIGRDGYVFTLVTGILEVRTSVRDDEVVTRLRQAGFDARRRATVVPRESFVKNHSDALRTGVAALLAGGGMIADHAAIPGMGNALLLSAILLGGWKVGVKSGKAILLLTLDMNVLMTVAVLGALAIGRWEEGASVIVLFSVALMLESYSVARTRNAIQSLMALSPDQATVARNGQEVVVAAGAVVEGDHIVIRPGERIPLDGEVVEGQSEVNESPITGEAVPVTKGAGQRVFAGTINGHGAMVVRVTRVYENTTLARIVQSIESAQDARAPIQGFIERFAAVYTPTVFIAALLVATVPPLLGGWPFVDWFYRALVLLVIACPCALVISTPVTMVSALAAAARKGILVKGGKFLEVLSGIRAIAFDKTGTLTVGRPRITDIITVDSILQDRAVTIAAVLEQRSEHHLASAFLAEAALRALTFDGITVEEFEALPGQGVQGTVGGTRYFLGNRQLCDERGALTAPVRKAVDTLTREGKTIAVLGTGQTPLCVIGLRDVLRPQSREAVEKIRKLGVPHIVILSGDHASAVEQLGDELGVEQLTAAMMPEAKVAAVRQLERKYGAVAMVGDGINDAPALAAASVGIAMGVGGTDTALETADVVLMSDDLAKIPAAIRLSRNALRIVRQNIILALGIKLVFLILTLSGVATLWMALLADDGAALLVILNGLRALSMPEEG